MICAQVFGNNTTVTFAGSQGNFELNAYKPVIIRNVLHSIRLLADGIDSFRRLLVEGTQPNEDKIHEIVGQSLMLVTALSPEIGYDKASKVAKHALKDGLTLKESAMELQMLSGNRFDELVKPELMISPK